MTSFSKKKGSSSHCDLHAIQDVAFLWTIKQRQLIHGVSALVS